MIVGSALAAHDGRFRPAPAIAALWGALFIQLGTNLVNDWGDFRRGADRRGRAGPPRVLAMGWLTPDQVRRGIVAAFLLATCAGLYLALDAGWPVVWIGLASIAAGIAYTAGPRPLAYNGTADLFVFLFFGLAAVCGTYFVETRGLAPHAVLAAIPAGTLATAILVVNNIRDHDEDRRSGKRTLAVRLGRGGARAEYLLLLAAAYATPVAWLSFGGGRSGSGGLGATVLLPLLTLPLAIREARRVLTHDEGPVLNAALVGTARLHLLFGILFAAGILLS